MNDTNRKGGSPLKSLLKVRRWDLDTAKTETVQARQNVEICARESEQIGGVVQQLENDLRGCCDAGAVIDPDRHVSLSVFLKEQRQALEKKLDELRLAEKTYEQSRNRLYRVKQGVMVLEKHLDKVDDEIRREELRRDQLQQDDLWLAKRREG